MRKQLILSAIIGLASLPSFGAGQADLTTYFSCDFSDGLPDGATVEDADGATLHFLMTQAGFKQGDSWKVLFDRPNKNYYLGSPSYHKTDKGAEPVPANDRFTLPPVLIRGAEASISWRCRSVNEQTSTATSTYSVLVNGTELLTKAETSLTEWSTQSLSLADYAGQTVTVTFVNNTLAGEIMALDDITISGLSGVANVEVVPGEYVLGSESFQIGVKVTATSPDEPVTSAEFTCTIGSETLTAEASDLNLTFGQSHTLLLDREITGKYGDSHTYTVTPTVNGTAYDPQTVTTTMLAFRPHKRTVLEETTGQWCGWCPLGIVAIDSLHMLFGSDVIPIAIHIQQDDMAYDAYAQAVNLGGGAAPVGYFDRQVYNSDPMRMIKVGIDESYTVWRGGFATDAEKQLATQALAEISVEAELSADGRTIDVSTVTRTAIDMPESTYRVALTMVEDGVWQPDYYQTNYLANYPNRAPVGDFCSRPDMIVDNMVYDHVARAVAQEAYTGIEGSLPAALTAGREYSFDYKWAVPANVLNPKRLKIVAMIVDADNHIVNAHEVAIDPTYTSIGSVDSATERVSVQPGSVTVTADGTVSATLIDLSGRTVATATASGSVTLSASPGIYLLRTPARTLKLRL